jgi:hypothetical protein
MRSAISQVLFEIFLVLAFAMVFVAGVAVGHAFAQEIPSEETKTWALKRAYQLNGNSMVGNNLMIDLTGETPFANPVKTEKVTVAPAKKVAAPVKNELDEQPDLNMNDLRKFSRRFNMKTDVCRQHKMHKVITGNSWRCRK